MAITKFKFMAVGESGSQSVETEHRYTITGRAYSDSITDTVFDVLSSPLVPQNGDPYYGWTKQPDGTYLENDPPTDENSVVVFVEAERLAEHPFFYDVKVTYEGIESPLATPPKISYEDVPYQEQRIQDINGLVKTNSALDVYEEGTDVDHNRQRLVITRNIPYDKWDPDTFEGYKNTLNLNPFYHGNLKRQTDEVDEDDEPILEAIKANPGHVKLTSITAERQIRLKNPVPTAGKYYWTVRAVLDFDYSQYIDNNGTKQYRKWCRVLIDAGYNERKEGKLSRIVTYNNGSASSGPQLLDGAGKRLLTGDTFSGTDDTTKNPPQLPFVPHTNDGKPVPEHDWYACRSGQTLRVPAPGVLANDLNAVGATAVKTSGPFNGTATLSTDGSYVYTPTGGFRGWDYFEYTATNTAGTSEPARVAILVGPVPRVRVFQDYPYKDWEPLAEILAGW